MKQLIMFLLLLPLTTACGNSNATRPQDTVTTEPATIVQPDESPKPQPVDNLDFDAFREQFPKEFPPYKLSPDTKVTGQPLPTSVQHQHLKRSVGAVPVVEILMEDDRYISLITAESPLEDVQTLVWNVYDIEGELLSHHIVAGKEGEDEFFGEFREDGTVTVDNFYPAGKDKRGEPVFGKRETVYQLIDGEVTQK